MVRERVLDMLYLLSLERDQQAQFFPSWAPVTSDIAGDVQMLVECLLGSTSDPTEETRAHLAEFSELIAINSMIASAPQDADFWSRTPKKWLWLDEAIRTVAKRAVERLRISPRPINQNTTWIPGG